MKLCGSCRGGEGGVEGAQARERGAVLAHGMIEIDKPVEKPYRGFRGETEKPVGCRLEGV